MHYFTVNTLQFNTGYIICQNSIHKMYWCLWSWIFYGVKFKETQDLLVLFMNYDDSCLKRSNHFEIQTIIFHCFGTWSAITFYPWDSYLFMKIEKCVIFSDLYCSRKYSKGNFFTRIAHKMIIITSTEQILYLYGLYYAIKHTCVLFW